MIFDSNSLKKIVSLNIFCSFSRMVSISSDDKSSMLTDWFVLGSFSS